MDKKHTVSMLIRCQSLTLAVLCASLTAQAWGPAVHTYVADQVNKKAGWKNVNEMYGGMAPDLINYMFFSRDVPSMYEATHFDFATLFGAARTPGEHTVALGFVTHNMAWGADYTAHSGSMTLDPTQGYVIQKAELLAWILKQDPGYASLGIPDAITLEICHPMVECSVDLLMRFIDPSLGEKIVIAEQQRDPGFPKLLAKAYAGEFAQYFGHSAEAAEQALIDAEAVFRLIVVEQGMAFQQDLPTALDLIAEQNTAMAQGFLSLYGVELPPGFEIKGLIVTLIGGGIQLCQEDFANEIQATVKMVKDQLKEQHYRFPQF